MRGYNLKIIIFILSLWLGHNAFCQTPQIEITSYDVNVKMDLPDSQLQVKARVELQKPDSISEFDILLTSDANLSSIRSKMKDQRIEMPHKFTGNDTLRITVPPELVSSKKLSVDFDYTLPIDKFKSKDAILILDRGHRWYPLILDQIAKFTLKAEVPKGYVVFSAGDFVEKKTFPEYSQYLWESKIPVFKLPLIIAKSDLYNETVKKCGEKEIYFCSSTVDKETKDKILSEACSTLKFYNESIGEYPHNRLTLIEIPELEGTNIATALLMVGPIFIDAFKQGQFDNLHLSIACQWMAAGVFFKFGSKGFWFLQLSLPHYLRLMYLERTKGKDAFTQGLQQGLDAYKEIAGSENEVSIMDVDFPNSKEKARAIYGKGPYVIDKVRRQVGDENWEELIKDIYKDFKGKILTYDEFINYLSRYDRDGTAVAKLKKMVSETGLPED
jgi:hypothetical protein